MRELENERQGIEAQTRVQVAQERQRGAVGMQEATRNAESEVAGLKAAIEAEKQQIEMVRVQYQANTIVPAQAVKQKKVEEARGEAARIRGQAQAELEQMSRTVAILLEGGSQGVTAYVIDKFGGLVEAFAQTMSLFPVREITVIVGEHEKEGPISAIHPSAVDNALNEQIAATLGLAPAK